MLNKHEVENLTVVELLSAVVSVVEKAKPHHVNGSSEGHDFTSEELDSLDLVARELGKRNPLVLRNHMVVPLLKRIVQNRRSLAKKEMKTQ